MSTNPSPRLGQLVLYTFTDHDAEIIIRRRRDAGLTIRSGNEPRGGDAYPAMIVRNFNTADGCVNLQVFLDGNDSAWCTSRTRFDKTVHGHWAHLVEGVYRQLPPETKISAQQLRNDVAAGVIDNEEFIFQPDARGHWSPA